MVNWAMAAMIFLIGKKDILFLTNATLTCHPNRIAPGLSDRFNFQQGFHPLAIFSCSID
jgi:hypothetical protein